MQSSKPGSTAGDRVRRAGLTTLLRTLGIVQVRALMFHTRALSVSLHGGDGDWGVRSETSACGYIAALHFNENSYRDQAVNKNGEPIYSISYPKGRKGAGIPKEVKIQQTNNYVLVLMEEVVKVRLELGSYRNVQE
uniref:Uncharacterized protein n=1 Tax=Magallana gigas TaxID=29159 RepID=A0A8W8L3T3_MAGGI